MITYAIIAGFESDGNARERRSRSFLYNGNVVPVVFFLYTPIVNCNFPWKSVLESNFSEKKLNLLK